MSGKKVYEAIAAVTARMAREGIGKDQKNQQQGYRYRGIDQVYAALSPALVEHKLCILPRVVDSSVVERQTQKGGTLIYTTLTVEFDFVSAEDGSLHIVRTVGEAMDSADKSSNKAMSAAYKYAAFMTFCIPTEGDNDADGTTYELAPERSSEPRVAANPVVGNIGGEGGSALTRGPATQEVTNAETYARLQVALKDLPADLVKIRAWANNPKVKEAIASLADKDALNINDAITARIEDTKELTK